MKRLLAYLCIILGLGLTFNVSAKAEVIYAKKLDNLRNLNDHLGNFYGITNKNFRVRGINDIDVNGKVLYRKKEGNAWVGTYVKNKNVYRKGYYKHTYENGDILYQYYEYDKGGNYKKITSHSITEDEFNLALKYIFLDIELPFDFSKNYSDNKTQIAKAEPSQTQKVAKKKELNDLDNIAALIDKAKEEIQTVEEQVVKTSNKSSLTLSEEDELKAQIFGCWSIPLGLPANENLLVRIKLELEPDGSIAKTEILDSARMNRPGQRFYKVLAESALRAVKLCQPLRVPSSGYDRWKTLTLNFDAREMLDDGFSSDTKIAKVEPSQTQKVAKKDIKFCVYKNSAYLTNLTGEKYRITRFDHPYLTCVSNFIIDSNYKDELFYTYLVDTIGIVESRGFRTLKPVGNWKPKNPIKPKKKVKVAKVEDSTQEEFKPKKTNQDNEAPVIEIAEAITVNDTSYEIEGKVVGKSKKLFVQIDGETIPVKKGKFKIKRFSPVDEQLKIVALDQWGNRSQPKLVNITIDQQETIVADTFENLDPSKIRTRSNKNRVALIIGIEKYDQTPEASYANLDAKYFYEYVRKGFGVSKANIKLLVDEDANLIQSLGTLNKWLPGKIKDGKTELIIFFAGHGLASNDGKELYLLPQDSDPDLLARTALSRTELFQQIIALNPKSVTMFLDTCYSGISRDEKTLLASARPVRILANDQDTPNNFTIFSASQLDQISSGLKEANHGIFSYYLMKGLEGKADSNKDKKITNGELLAYMDQNVSQKASELGRQQNPSLAGDPNKILMSYR